MKSLDGILKIVDDEIGTVVKNGKFRTREEIEAVYKLIDIAKDVYCIWDYEDGEEEMSYADGPYMRDDRGTMPYSYRGRRNAKRDSMGRYSRGYRMGGYSRAEGKEDYIDHLREMMEDAPDEKTRQSMKRMIDQMEGM